MAQKPPRSRRPTSHLGTTGGRDERQGALVIRNIATGVPGPRRGAWAAGSVSIRLISSRALPAPARRRSSNRSSSPTRRRSVRHSTSRCSASRRSRCCATSGSSASSMRRAFPRRCGSSTSRRDDASGDLDAVLERIVAEAAPRVAGICRGRFVSHDRRQAPRPANATARSSWRNSSTALPSS